MKKSIAYLIVIFIGITYYQCSYPDECAQIDWVGVYTLDDNNTNCTDSQGNNIFPTEIVIEAGSDFNKIILNGVEESFRECEADIRFGKMNIENNDFNLSKDGCNVSYAKT